MFGFGGQGKGLAVVAILLGLSAPASAGDEAVLYASLGDTTRSPIGWVEFCADNPGECRGGASQPRDIVMSQAAWRDLLISISNKTDKDLFREKLRSAPIEMEIDAALNLRIGIFKIVGKAGDA